MRLPATKRFQWNYTALAFALPAGLMLIFMFITSCEPFGKHCMLYSDMFHQYYPFFCAFREALRSGDSLLYSWNVGMGMEYLGLISYYLASPLNLFSVLLPESWTLEYFSLLLPIKMGLASLFFAIMLKKLYGKDDLSIVLFGTFYGMCAWALGYNWNIMWMDSFALLPLVVLGTVSLLRDRKFILYTVTLFLSIFSNYYIGLFVCIFVFFLFFAYQICRCRSFWRFWADLARIGVFTLLAIGMTAILELPTLAALQDTQSSVNIFPEGFSVNIATGEAVDAAREAWQAFSAAKADSGEWKELCKLFLEALKAAFPPVLDAMGQVAGNMGAAITPTFMDGLPNLYCGVLPIALAFLFLLSKDVKLREKLCGIGFLVFFILSFIFRQLDYIWHGFHFTNQIPYRFSFLFSFVLLCMAYGAWVRRDSFRIWQVMVSGALSVGILSLAKQERSDIVYWIVNLLLLGTYLVAMLYENRHWPQPARSEAVDAEGIVAEEADAEMAESEALPLPEPAPRRCLWEMLPTLENRRRSSAMIFAVMLSMELVVNLATFGSAFPVNKYDYPKKTDTAASMLKVMQELEDGDSLFYRAEMTHAQTLNDAALNGYHGLTTFTSSANVQMTKFAQALGFGAYSTWNRYLYEEGSPVTNLFTSLKYLIERDDPHDGNAYFDAIHSFDGVTLLENNAYLPLGFLAQSMLGELNFPSGSSFSFQNQLFRTATGVYSNVWHTVSGSDVQVLGSDKVTINSSMTNSGYTSFTSQPGGGSLTYEYTISREGYFCLDVNLYSQKNFTVWLNGNRVYTESISLAQMFGVDDVKPGDVVQVVVETLSDTTGSVSIRAAILDEQVFREGYDVLRASTLELTEFSNTYVAGTIDCDRDGLLYTSIPQCGNARTEGKYDENGEWVEAVIESEGNWKVYVDGKEVPITLVGNCMIAVDMTKGSHRVEFVYENPAFTLGWKVSLMSAGVFGLCIAASFLVDYLRKKRAK